jgi:L-fuconolactonase
MNVIDAHHHVWDLSVRDQDWITGPRMAAIRRSFCADDLRPAARAAGVTATVLVQTVTVPEETPEMLALAAADPLVAAVVGWADLTSPAVADELARLKDVPGGRYLAGIRHQVQSEPDPDWLRRPDVIRGLRAVAAAGLCYDLIVTPHQLPAAAYAAAAVPELTMVLDHAAKPPLSGSAVPDSDLGSWAAGIRALAARPNAVCKLSGLVTEAPAGAPDSAFLPVADVILNEFGPQRIMFGSDWPVCLLAAGYADVVRLAAFLVGRLPAADQAAVFGLTAARVYGIGQSGRDAGEGGGGAWLLPTRPSRRSSR